MPTGNNQQPELFPDDRFAGHRRRDPETSREAAQALPGVEQLRGRMLAAYRERGRLTANEAAELCHRRWPTTERESYRKRNHELERLGLIVAIGRRLCRAKPGRTQVMVYEIAGGAGCDATTTTTS